MKTISIENEVYKILNTEYEELKKATGELRDILLQKIQEDKKALLIIETGFWY